MPGKAVFTGRITIRSEHAGFARLAADALAPDNLPDMMTYHDDTSSTIVFETDKLSALIASVDDYLMNAKAAWDIVRMDKLRRKAQDKT